MAYLGNRPAEAYSAFQKQDFSTSATTSYTLDHPVANQNEIALFINFVRQEPTAAYTASGTTLTLTSATSSSDDMYCVYLGQAKQTVNAPDGSVGSSQVASTIITGQTAETSIATDDTILIHDTSAGALRKMTRANFVSGVGGDNTPAFQAYLSSNQSYTDNTLTKVQFNTEVFDTDGTYDNSTNYRFTPAVAGKYYIYSDVTIDVTDLTNKLYTCSIRIYKNGSEYKATDQLFDYSGSSGLDIFTAQIFTTMSLNTTDYIEIYAKGNGDQNGNFRGSSELFTTFGAYKIIE